MQLIKSGQVLQYGTCSFIQVYGVDTGDILDSHVMLDMIETSLALKEYIIYLEQVNVFK